MEKFVKSLIVRSASKIFNRALEDLKKEFPKSKITVIATSDAENSLKNNSLVDEYILLPQGRMNLFKLGWKNLKKLRKEKFDLGVALYNYKLGLGYSNIDFMIFAISPKEFRSFNIYNEWVKIKTNEIFKKWVKERFYYIFVFLNLILTYILFFLIFISIFFEEKILRKFNHQKPYS